MNQGDGLLIYGVFGVILLMASVPFVALRLRDWLETKAPVESKSPSRLTHYTLVVLSVVIILGGVAAVPAMSEEIFTLSTERGLEFYVVDNSLQKPIANLSSIDNSSWPSIQGTGLTSTAVFRDSEFKDSSLIVDPGFRTSLTNRIVTVGGRIDWVTPLEKPLLASPLGENEIGNLAKLNLERLSGIQQIAFQTIPGEQVIEIN